MLKINNSVSGSASGVALTGIPGNHTDWNTVASTVGCGNGWSLLYSTTRGHNNKNWTAATAQQFRCMQAVPAVSLENAVISTGAAFSLVVDSELSCICAFI